MLKSILGTIYKACLGYKTVKTNGEWGDGRRDELGSLADQYLDRDIKSQEQKGSEGLG